MAKTVLRLTNKSSLVKVTDAAATIALATDLKLTSETLAALPIVPTVSLYRVYATGNFTIARNSVTILSSTSGQMFDLDFSQMEGVDNIEGVSDIVVTPSAGVQVYLVLRKETGYIEGFQPEIYGSYDNPLLVTA